MSKNTNRDKHFFPTSGKNTGEGCPAVDYLLTLEDKL
jgi:hypothetical protein